MLDMWKFQAFRVNKVPVGSQFAWQKTQPLLYDVHLHRRSSVGSSETLRARKQKLTARQGDMQMWTFPLWMRLTYPRLSNLWLTAAKHQIFWKYSLLISTLSSNAKTKDKLTLTQKYQPKTTKTKCNICPKDITNNIVHYIRNTLNTAWSFVLSGN